MSVRIVAPEKGEHVSLSVNTAFLLASRIVLDPRRAGSLHLSAGHVSTGGGTLHLHFDNTDYAREMAKAVIDAIEAVNQRWGLPQSCLDDSFTGMQPPVNPETGN
ncbi:hypothetical protein [Brucella tritici]|nr:hypothetical protein [Brucella tritici]